MPTGAATAEEKRQREAIWTARAEAVAQMVADGMSTNAIAKACRVHKKTIRWLMVRRLGGLSAKRPEPKPYIGPHDDEIRRLIANDRTQPEIAAELGMSESAVQRACDRLGLKSSDAARERAQRLGQIKALAARKANAKPRKAPEPSAAPRHRNPMLTQAQQDLVDSIKRRNWKLRDARLMAMPEPTREEADSLVAAFLARGGQIKVCEPAATLDTASNPLAPWRSGGGTIVATNAPAARRGRA